MARLVDNYNRPTRQVVNSAGKRTVVEPAPAPKSSISPEAWSSMMGNARSEAPGGPQAWDSFTAGQAPNPYVEPAAPQFDESGVEAMRQNIAAQRGSINQEYATALADLSAAEGRAHQAIGGLPPALQKIYGDAATAIDTQTAASKQSQAATGLQSFTPAGAGVEPMRAALDAGQASRQADVGLLNLGATSLAAGQRGALRVAQQQALGDIAAQEAGINAQAAADKNAWAQQVYMHNQQRAEDLADYRRSRRDSITDQGRADAAANAQYKAEQAAAEPTDTSSPAWWSWYKQAHPEEAKQVVDSQTAKDATRLHDVGTPEEDRSTVGTVVGGIAGLPFGPLGAAAGGWLGGKVGSGTSTKKLTLPELLKKYPGPKYARTRAYLTAMYSSELPQQ